MIGTWLMGHLLRWFPHRVGTGLVPVGNPDEDSPVLVSCNYSLSVARLLGALRGLDAWVLVAQSGGINVWCAAAGGTFTDHQVVSAIKTSMLAEKVRHRRVILPALAAPGMDLGRIEAQTGFRARFGPVRARDIPAYLEAGMERTEPMRRYGFGLADRMDKLVSMNFVTWAPAALVFAIFWPEHLAHLSALFWGAALLLYVFLPWIPGRTGWRKALVAIALICAGYLAAGHLLAGHALAHWPWMIGAALMTFMIGFDLAGIASMAKSDAEMFLHRIGLRSMGSFMKEKAIGAIALDAQACTGCDTCNGICPLGVFERDEEAGKTSPARASDCFSCGACVKQCPEGALSIREG